MPIEPLNAYGQGSTEAERVFREVGGTLVMFDAVHPQLRSLYSSSSHECYSIPDEDLNQGGGGDDGALYWYYIMPEQLHGSLVQQTPMTGSTAKSCQNARAQRLSPPALYHSAARRLLHAYVPHLHGITYSGTQRCLLAPRQN